MLTDNLGWGEIGPYGGGILRGAPTPRLDELANAGFIRPLLEESAAVGLNLERPRPFQPHF
jgi:hypothetical protein